jgi:hypothetical protein
MAWAMASVLSRLRLSMRPFFRCEMYERFTAPPVAFSRS